VGADLGLTPGLGVVDSPEFSGIVELDLVLVSAFGAGWSSAGDVVWGLLSVAVHLKTLVRVGSRGQRCCALTLVTISDNQPRIVGRGWWASLLICTLHLGKTVT